MAAKRAEIARLKEERAIAELAEMEAEDAAEAELEEEVDSHGVVAKDEMLARRLQIAEQFRIFTPPASTSSQLPLLVQPPPGLTMISLPKSGTLLTAFQLAPFLQHSSNVPGSTLLTQAPFPHGMCFSSSMSNSTDCFAEGKHASRRREHFGHTGSHDPG